MVPRYLQHLQRLHKWRRPQRNMEVGDIVVIREDIPFTQHWPLAWITALFPGKVYESSKSGPPHQRSPDPSPGWHSSFLSLLLPWKLGKGVSSGQDGQTDGAVSFSCCPATRPVASKNKPANYHMFTQDIDLH